MVRSCAVFGCLSSSGHDKDRHFYGFPSDEDRRRKWIEASGRSDLANKSPEILRNYYYVCDLHFQNSDRLARNLVPTLNLPLRENSHPSKLTQTENETKCFILLSQMEAATQTAVSSTSHVAIQTTQDLIASIPRVKKMQTELKAECKRRKNLENEKKYAELHKKKKLSPQLNNLIDLQYRLQQNSRGNRYEKEYKLFALNIYFASPLAYRVLAKTLSLPSERTLHRMNIKIGTKLYSNVYDCLKSKLKNFKNPEKYCVICADEIPLKRNLHYQINEDKIIGFHEIDGVQTTEPASNGFVIMVRGIFSTWEQQLGYSLLAQSKNYKELNDWLDNVISEIINIGFKVVAVVSNQGANFLNLATQRGVSSDNPYFCINGRKIYYIFDVPHLIRSVRNNLIKYDFDFMEIDGTTLTAKWDDVQNFYNQDSKRSYRLAPKLKESHINPNKFEKMNMKTATQVFSNTVAAAMNSSIECGHLELSAKGTVKFIDLMDKTFDILNSSVKNDPNKYKNAFAFKPYQTDVLDRLDSFLSTVSVVTKTKKDVTNSVRCLKGLRITIESIKSLAQELQSDGCRFLYTRRLNLEPLEKFFGSIKQQCGHCREPTPLKFTKAFSTLFMVNMLKQNENANSADDFDKLLMNADDISQINQIQSMNEYLQEDTCIESLAIGTVDYRFDLPQENAFDYVCEYLLKKCADFHKCPKIDIFLKQCQHDVKENVLSNEAGNDKTLLINAPESFVIFVKEIDDRFKNFFQQNIRDRVGSEILKELNDLSFTDCCECFPNEYLKRLFVRFRIFNIIKFNNQVFRDKSLKLKHFSVCDI